MKQSYLLFLIPLLFSVSFLSCKNDPNLGKEKTPNETIEANAIDKYVTNVMDRYGIPGATVAIIKNNKIIHRNNYGLASIEHNVPVTDSTIFRVYSITKLFITVGIFQLIEQKKLNLDDNISKYLPNLPKEWQDIQIKYLITHSSGLPDYKSLENFKDLSKEEVKEQLFTKDLLYKTGERYEYNQTNYWFLHEIIEKASGLSLTDFIIPNQFSNTTNTVFFSSDSREIVKHRTTHYFPFAIGKLSIEHPYGGDYNFATNGMNLTLSELIDWSNKLDNNRLLKEETLDLMWEEFPFDNNTDLFTIGWKKFSLEGATSYGFSGNLTNAYRIFPEQNLSVVFLSNGLTTIFDVDEIANHLAFLADEKLKNPETFTHEKLMQVSFKVDANLFERTYEQLKSEEGNAVDFEDILNDIGYFHLRKENYDMAIRIFELNSYDYPLSWNVFDSLGEAYETSGNINDAIIQYQKAIELNQENEFGNNVRLTDKIAELEKETN